MKFAIKVIAKSLVAKHILKGKDFQVFSFKDVTHRGKFYPAKQCRDNGFDLMMKGYDESYEVYKGVVDANGDFIADQE